MDGGKRVQGWQCYYSTTRGGGFPRSPFYSRTLHPSFGTSLLGVAVVAKTSPLSASWLARWEGAHFDKPSCLLGGLITIFDTTWRFPYAGFCVIKSRGRERGAGAARHKSTAQSQKRRRNYKQYSWTCPTAAQMWPWGLFSEAKKGGGREKRGRMVKLEKRMGK